MTSLKCDDQIDMLPSVQKANDDSWVTVTTTDALSATDLTLVPSGTYSADGRSIRKAPPLTNAGSKDDRAMSKQKKVKMAVIIVTLALILTSMILVGVTLSMSGHIDDMVRQRYDGFSSTWRTPIANSTKPSSSSSHVAGRRR